MTRPLLLALVLLASTAAQARPKDPAGLLDQATACARRAEHACVLKATREALQVLGAAGDGRLRREALLLQAEALALSDQPAQAGQAFSELLRIWPGWRPAPDVDLRVRTAFEGAEQKLILGSLPTALSEPPRPPAILPPPDSFLPPPVLYAPQAILEIDVAKARQRHFRMSLGGGAAFTYGTDAERIGVGAAASLDFHTSLLAGFGPWAQVTITLHNFKGNVPIEPNYSRGLTTILAVAGAGMDVPVYERLELFFAAGIGAGSYGLRAVNDVVTMALQAVGGIRYQATDPLGVRLDLTPTLFVGTAAEHPDLASHLNLMLRAELHF
jgi:hypothetical protein